MYSPTLPSFNQALRKLYT